MSSPALFVQTPQIQSPLATLGQLAQLRGVNIENALRQQQIQQSQAQMANLQAEADLRQRSIRGQQKLSAIVADPANQKMFATGDYSPILSSGVDPSILEPVVKGLDAMRTAAMNHDKEQSALDADARKQLADSLATIDPEDPTSAQTANQMIKNYAGGGPSHAKIAAQMPTFTQDNFHQQFKQATTGNNLATEMLTARAAMKEATAKASKEQAEAGLSQAALDLMNQAKAGAPGGQHPIDQIFAGRTNDPAYQNFRNAWDTASVKPDAKDPFAHKAQVAQDAIKYIAEKEQKAYEATDPNIRRGKAATAAAEAAVTEPIRAHALADAQVYANKLQGGPLSAIINPQERNEVSQAQIKANADYQEQAATASRLKQFVDAARSGNQAAAGLLPVATVRELVNRVNTQELQAVGGGSIFRRIENGLEKAGEGRPSDATLNDIAQIANMAVGSAAQKYTGVVRNLNQNHRTTFDEKAPQSSLPSSTSSQRATVHSQAEFDALPKGAEFIDARDGKAYRK